MADKGRGNPKDLSYSQRNKSAEKQVASYSLKHLTFPPLGSLSNVILLDFAKAFDKLPHQRLLNKLKYYRIRGCTLHWIGSFLSDKKQRALVEGMSSDIADMNFGVPRGTLMGPHIIPCQHQ